MKKKLRRVTFEEVEVCDRCENKAALSRFRWRWQPDLRETMSDSSDTDLLLCKSCATVVTNVMKMRRRPRKATPKPVKPAETK